MTADLADGLRGAGFRGEILREEPLARHTTWRIGGPAEALAFPTDRDDLGLAIRFANERACPYRVLGNGSNLLVRDGGVRGLVLRPRGALAEVRVARSRIEAGSGAALPAVARLAAERGLSGLEFAAGIPGTVGGAVIMNAGSHEHEIAAVVESVEFLDPRGAARRIPAGECGFGYRRSALRGLPGVVLEAALVLRPDDPAAVRERIAGFSASRRASQPTELPSCGSVFRNPPGDSAGRLIDRAGLKGLRVGDIEVSPRHANFLVNVGLGSARDALALVEIVEREVRDRFGVALVREFELW